LERKYDESIGKGRKDRPDGNEFTELSILCSSEFSKVFVVLDAFDEFADQKESDLKKYLGRLSTNPQIQMFTTTQSYLPEDLEDSFSRGKT
jgi:hypothetical protein